MFSVTKANNNLNCTEEEFNIYISEYIENSSKIAISLNKYSFDDSYNGHKIENPFSDDNARYYILSIEWGNTYLQTHVPYITGMEMITDENFEEISSSHCEQLSEQFIEAKAFNEAINYFKK